MCYLNTEFMVKLDGKYIFTFDKLTKRWRAGRPSLMIEFNAYPQNSKLCVVKAIDSYLQLTQFWRNTNNQKQLLLSIIRPPGHILESKGMGAIFQKKGKVMLQKGKIFENLI